jgi:hypothetical protein
LKGGTNIVNNITVQVTDQYGGYINSAKEVLTGLIHTEIFNGRTGDLDEYLFDPNEPKVVEWLKSVYQPIHLNILLGK